MWDKGTCLAAKALVYAMDLSRHLLPTGNAAWNCFLALSSLLTVPGYVTAMVRASALCSLPLLDLLHLLAACAVVEHLWYWQVWHFRTVVLREDDHGWLHTFLAEAQNERMHMLIFLDIVQAGFLVRAALAFAQVACASVSHLFSRRTACSLLLDCTLQSICTAQEP